MNYLETQQGKKLFKKFLKKYSGKSSQKVYRSEINQFFNWYEGSLTQITRSVLQDYSKHLAESKKAKTIKRKFSILNQFFKFVSSHVKGFSSPMGKKHGDVQSLQSASYHESETFLRNLEYFLAGLKRDNTKKTYATNTRLFFQWAKKAPGKLTQADFIKYKDYLLDEKEQKIATVWNKLISVNRFLTVLAGRNSKFRNPLDFSKLNLDDPPKASGYNNVLTHTEIKALLKAPDRRTLIGKRDYAMLMLMVIYGPRAGEVCKLRWKDMMPKEGNQQKIWIRDRKGKKRVDTVYILNGKLLQAFDDWIESCNVNFEPDTPVFLGFIWDLRTKGLEINQRQIREQKTLTVTTIENIVGKYIEKAGVLKPGDERILSPHALRHTAFTELSNAGEPVAKIKYLAGHQDVNTTMIYAHHGETHDDNIALRSRFNK